MGGKKKGVEEGKGTRRLRTASSQTADNHVLEWRRADGATEENSGKRGGNSF